jgi:2-polyprenyl-3-methyl-5-hydroxy-6-metoxy-1,4-benzoquinol methylase
MMTISKTIEYYNNNADQFFDSTFSLDLKPLYTAFLNELGSGAKLLDAGCGSGRDSHYFTHQGYDVTSFDASEALVKKAEILLGHSVLCNTFQNIKFTDHFDGMWACASLLHVAKDEITSVMFKLSNALTESGVMYVSFKYGESERKDTGRLFNDYTETSFDKMIQHIPELKVLKYWTTHDVRPDRNERWLNILIKKVK